jgi:hypothetical protein
VIFAYEIYAKKAVTQIIIDRIKTCKDVGILLRIPISFVNSVITEISVQITATTTSNCDALAIINSMFMMIPPINNLN